MTIYERRDGSAKDARVEYGNREKLACIQAAKEVLGTCKTDCTRVHGSDGPGKWACDGECHRIYDAAVAVCDKL